MGKKHILILWPISIVLAGFIIWQVAPNEKVVYKEAKQTCKHNVEIGEHGLIEYGDFAGKTGVVESIDDAGNCDTYYDYIVVFEDGTYQKVDGFNLYKINPPKEDKP